MNNILSLINPARIIKVEDAMKIAKLLPNSYNQCLVGINCCALMESFESLYALKLEKGHFVCEVEKPRQDEYGGGYSKDAYLNFLRAEKEYEAAQAKVIFEGFEETDHIFCHVENREHNIGVHFNDDDGTFYVCFFHDGDDILCHDIGDFLHEVKRYNRTAAQKIPIKYTSNILSLLKIEG